MKLEQVNIEYILSELEKFGENVMLNLELIKQKEINCLGKIKIEEIEKYHNLFEKEIEYHKNLAKEEVERLKSIVQEELKYFKIIKEEYDNFKKPLNFSFNQNMMGNAGPLLSKSKSGYNNITNIKVIFEENNSEINNEINQTPIIIECPLKGKISQLIEKYYEKIGNNSHNKKFLFCNFELSPDLTLEQSLLFDGCKIKVVNA